MLDNFLIQITIFFLENKTPGKAWYFKISQKRLDISTDCFWAPQKSYKDNVWKFPDNYNQGYFQYKIYNLVILKNWKTYFS